MRPHSDRVAELADTLKLLRSQVPEDVFAELADAKTTMLHVQAIFAYAGEPLEIVGERGRVQVDWNP